MGIYGMFLITGNAGFIPSTEGLPERGLPVQSVPAGRWVGDNGI